MRDEIELSAAIQTAMKNNKLSPEALGKTLEVSAIMVNKIICGEVVPSGHLEKQMIEILKINPDRVKNLGGRRRQGASAAMSRESRTKKAA